MGESPEFERETRDLLDDVAVDYLRRDGVEVEIEDGTTILGRGHAVGDFWVILEGEVEVRRRSSQDGHLTLARRGPGGTFGEVAILRSAPVSADVIAVTLVRVAFVVFAAILSATILWNARGHAVHSGERINAYGWTVLIIGCTVYTAMALWMVV